MATKKAAPKKAAPKKKPAPAARKQTGTKGGDGGGKGGIDHVRQGPSTK